MKYEAAHSGNVIKEHIVVHVPSDDDWLCNWMFVDQGGGQQHHVGYAPSYDGWLC